MRQNCSNIRGRSAGTTRSATVTPRRSANTGPCTVRRIVSGTSRSVPSACRTLIICCLDLERPRLAVQHVAVALQRQSVDVGAGRAVRRLRPRDELGEALAQHREADPHRAVRRHARRRELHFEVGVVVGPRQVRVAHQHRVAGRALRRRDRPAVRSVRLDHFLPRLPVDVLLARQPVVVNDAQAVRVDVLGASAAARASPRRSAVLGFFAAHAFRPSANARISAPNSGALLRRPLLRLLRECRSSAPSDRSPGRRRRRTRRRGRAPARRAAPAARRALPSARSRRRRTGSDDPARRCAGCRRCPTGSRSLSPEPLPLAAGVDRDQRERDDESDAGATESRRANWAMSPPGVPCITPLGAIGKRRIWYESQLTN